MPSLPRLSGASIALALILGIMTTRTVHAAGSNDDHDQFRSSVFACESAVVHLVDCCPRFEAERVACTFDYQFTAGACDSPDTTSWQYPAISESESRCIRGTSCEQLRSSGACERAQQLQAPHGSSWIGRGDRPGYSSTATEAGTACL